MISLDGSTDNTAELQALVDRGGRVDLPAGVILIGAGDTGLRITKPLALRGAGNGITTLASNAKTAHVIDVQCAWPVELRDFRIASPAYRTAGAGIRLSGAATALLNPLVENVAIHGQYDGILIENAGGWVVRGCRITDFANAGIKYTSPVYPDGAGAGVQGIYDTLMWSLNVPGRVGFEFQAGGDTLVSGSTFLGSATGLFLNLHTGPTGNMRVIGCDFGDLVECCVEVSQAVPGADFLNMMISSCVFENVSASRLLRGVLRVNAGVSTHQPRWIQNISFTGNAIWQGSVGAKALVSIRDGYGVMVANNVINSNGNPQMGCFEFVGDGKTGVTHLVAQANILTGASPGRVYATPPNPAVFA